MLRCIAMLALWTVFSCLPVYAADVNDKADEVLREVSTFLGSLNQFTYHVESSADEVLSTGQLIQLGHGGDIAVRRPDRIWAKTEGDTDNQQFFYDGKSVTLFNSVENVYATIDAPATIDTALDYSLKAFEIKAPLSSLIVSDMYARVSPSINTGNYLGLHRAQGVPCHHLAFSTDEVDWQIWVDAGDKPWPLKVVITSKRVAGAPQYTAYLSNWSTSETLDDSKFRFNAPKGAQKIEFLPAGN